MTEFFKYLKGDRALWVIAILFSLLSLVTVYSFVPVLVKQQGGSPEGHLIKHTIILITGFVVMFYTHRINYKYFSRLSQIAYWLAVVLLILTIFVGVEINHAKRWIEIPVLNQSFQTSDFAKLALIMYVARMLVLKKDMLHDFRNGVWPILWPILLVCALILPQDFSTAGMLFVICMILLFVANVPVKHMAKIFGGCILLLVLIFAVGKSMPQVFPRAETWSTRIESFWQDNDEVDQDDKDQLMKAQYAIANGGFWGVGPGKGEYKKIMFAAPADLFYASFIEEHGAKGAIFLILMFLIILYRSMKVAVKCEKNFGSYLCIGIAIALMCQAMINMAVPTGLVPMTGQNMPLLGLGGTSIWFTCISLGIIISVSRDVYTDPELDDKNMVKEDESKDEKYAVT